jgi:transposase
MKQGQRCWGGAPSLMPNKAGDRVPTDRRDAVQLARLMRAGDLTPVAVPAVADEASRDLRRARDDAIRDRKTATCRRTAFGLRHDRRDTGRATWRPAPLRWRAAVVWATPAPQLGCQAYGRAVQAPTERVPRLDHARPEPVQAWRRPPVGAALEGLRGVPCPVAVTRGAARGDLTRVEPPRPGLHDLGLIPAAAASGARRRQGALPPAGHTQARHAWVDGAWASREPAQVSHHLPRRLDKPPPVIQDISGQAQVRRGQRSRRGLARGTHAHQVVVAMARELAGLMGAIAPPGSGPPEGRWTAGH